MGDATACGTRSARRLDHWQRTKDVVGKNHLTLGEALEFTTRTGRELHMGFWRDTGANYFAVGSRQAVRTFGGPGYKSIWHTHPYLSPLTAVPSPQDLAIVATNGGKELVIPQLENLRHVVQYW